MRLLRDSKPVILDCVFNEAEKTFYVLDVMCWMNHPVYDSDTEFRFFWLQAKFSEVPNASEISDINPFAFIPLPCYPCSKSTMESVMGREMPFKADLDGILFYHKQTHYTTGSTPLVGWLKPWMLPEVLRVSVPQKYIDSKPPEEPWKPPNIPSEMECSTQESMNGKQTEEHAG
ncbi:putative snurportin-1-like [Apostichopus japonicus]|uniref:Snurportin-1 n=1 Tax=Stichopus japonicus TaxID=307972 RepID=A0A2G8KDW7_STIJA|nr:putative snurportin-1-like [Apostichopus japonicus]